MGKTKDMMFVSIAMCPFCHGHNTMGNYKGRLLFHRCLDCQRVFMAEGVIRANKNVPDS
jgi:hypothetical protein